MCVCVFFPPRLSLSVCQILWMCRIPFDFTEMPSAISDLFFLFFFYNYYFIFGWPEGGVSGHV